MFCQYKNLFGPPGEGIRKHRIPIINLAWFDVSVVAFVGYLISKYLNYSAISVFIFLFIMTVVTHRVFCVETALDKFLFPPKKN